MKKGSLSLRGAAGVLKVNGRKKRSLSKKQLIHNVYDQEREEQQSRWKEKIALYT